MATSERAETVGAVTAIAAPSRYRVAVRGRQDHVGGTPMADRKDAAVAAAELVWGADRTHIGEERSRWREGYRRSSNADSCTMCGG